MTYADSFLLGFRLAMCIGLAVTLAWYIWEENKMDDLREPWPWQCRNCRDWDDFTYRFHECQQCNDTRIAWVWLREFKWRWDAFSWYRLRPIRYWVYERCPDCKRPYRIFGIYLWRWHPNCIPF